MKDLKILQNRSLMVGAIGITLCIIGGFFNTPQFYRSYLFSYIFYLGIALGSLAILMIHHLAGGNWGYIIRRFLEAASRTLPLIAVLFFPMSLGLRHLYLWAQPEMVSKDLILQHKVAYLNTPFFLVRLLFYFIIWVLISYFLNSWSSRQDETSNADFSVRLKKLSGPGLVIYGFTSTFAIFDWVMSLQPHWFSTMYGAIFMVSQALTSLCLMIVVLAVYARSEPFLAILRPRHSHDLGNILLAFVMLWTYLSFSQLLIVWSANLPEEIPWYMVRLGPGWRKIAIFILLFHFIIPFLLLLMRQTKRRLLFLAILAVSILVMRLVDLFWNIAAPFQSTGPHPHWMDGVMLLGLGGIWFGVFLWQLRQKPLLAVHDERIEGEELHD
jgi:hypothetical protein